MKPSSLSSWGFAAVVLILLCYPGCWPVGQGDRGADGGNAGGAAAFNTGLSATATAGTLSGSPSATDLVQADLSIEAQIQSLVEQAKLPWSECTALRLNRGLVTSERPLPYESDIERAKRFAAYLHERDELDRQISKLNGQVFRILAEALELAKSRLGDHELTAMVHDELAALHAGAGHHTLEKLERENAVGVRSRSKEREALAKAADIEQHSAADSLEVIPSLRDAAAAAAERKEWGKALSLQQRIRAIQEKRLGPADYETIGTLATEGELLLCITREFQSDTDAAAAAACLTQAVSLYEQHLWEDSAFVFDEPTEKVEAHRQLRRRYGAALSAAVEAIDWQLYLKSDWPTRAGATDHAWRDDRTRVARELRDRARRQYWIADWCSFLKRDRNVAAIRSSCAERRDEKGAQSEQWKLWYLARNPEALSLFCEILDFDPEVDSRAWSVEQLAQWFRKPAEFDEAFLKALQHYYAWRARIMPVDDKARKFLCIARSPRVEVDCRIANAKRLGYSLPELFDLLVMYHRAVFPSDKETPAQSRPRPPAVQESALPPEQTAERIAGMGQ